MIRSPGSCDRGCRSNRRSTPNRQATPWYPPSSAARSTGNGEAAMDAKLDPVAEAPVSLKTWIAVAGALLGAFLAVLNIQITNASLPYIEGGISTGGVYGTWISTAY